MRDWTVLARQHPDRFVRLDGRWLPMISGGTGIIEVGTAIAIASVVVSAAGVAMTAVSQAQAQDAANRQARSQAEAARIGAEAERAREQAIYDQQLEQQRLDREAAGRQADAIEQNAAFARDNAEAARAAAGIEDAQKREQLRRIRSKQLAAFGSAGVVLGQGTPLLVEMSSALEESKILAGEALVSQSRVGAFEQEEALQRISASNVRLKRSADPVLLPARSIGTDVITRNPYLAAGGTLLTGAGNILSRWPGRKSTPSSVGDIQL